MKRRRQVEVFWDRIGEATVFLAVFGWILCFEGVRGFSNLTIGSSRFQRSPQFFKQTDDCQKLFSAAMKHMGSFFGDCIPSNTIPTTICENCGESYREAMAKFDTLRQTEACLDASQIPMTSYSTLETFWEDTDCNKCYESPVSIDSHSTPPKFKSDVVKFKEAVASVDKCLADNAGQQGCDNCRKQYEKLMDQYKTLLYETAEEEERAELEHARSSHSHWQLLDVRPVRAFYYQGSVVFERSQTQSAGGFHLCIDAVLALNTTKTAWIQHGCKPKMKSGELTVPIIVVVVLLALPVIFYLMAFCVSVRRKPYVQAQQKRLRWRYDTLTDDYIDDRAQERTNRT